MRNVEAFNALGQFGKTENFLQFLLNSFRVGLEHAKALIIGLLRVSAGKVDEGALVAALRNQNMNSRGAGI